MPIALKLGARAAYCIGVDPDAVEVLPEEHHSDAVKVESLVRKRQRTGVEEVNDALRLLVIGQRTKHPMLIRSRK